MSRALRKWRLSTATITLLLAAGSSATSSLYEDTHLVPIHRARLCVTKGAIEEAGGSQLEVRVPEMRAVVGYPTKTVAEAKFTYLGPTSKDKPLRSGQIRRQFALKLRAQNGCNLVYATWRIKPKSELVILVKVNPGQTTNAECGTNGYRTIKPTRDLKAPRLIAGESHTLRAEMEGTRFQVRIDGKLTWEGYLEQRDMFSFDGPSSVRTDNGRFKFEFFSSAPVPGRENPPCHAADEDE